jgi:hypothetical protein
MKTRRVALLISVLAAAVGGGVFFGTRPTPAPVLVFDGYSGSVTNRKLFANFELRNTTGRTIWLLYSGEEFPLSPPFLERPIAVQPQLTNGVGLNFEIGHVFSTGEKVPPGGKMLLEFPLHPGEPAKQVGLRYYSGKFTNVFDFMNSTRIQADSRAKWKRVLTDYWCRLGGSSKPARSREVWCEEMLSFQTGTDKLARE